MAGDYSDACIEVLRLLRERHNVLVAGPPGTGKSRLLNEVAQAFLATAGTPPKPMHVPGAKVPIPKNPPTATPVPSTQPSPTRTSRRVFRTVFHQNSKYRDFVSGLVPAVRTAFDAPTHVGAFRVVEGIMYRASEHARGQDGASLLIIDEINRGPAVQVFGGSIVAIESDKRLAPDGTMRPEAQPFEVLVPNGDTIEYYLPHHLYLLAAMNQADTSVEPLDVAFLRRWTPYKIDPSDDVLRTYFGLPSLASALPAQPTAAAHVYEALVGAWAATNERIRLGRGGEFRIGHGVLMRADSPPQAPDTALRFAAEGWNVVRAHIDEVFFGHIEGIAAVLNVSPDSKSHPYKVEQRDFADEPRLDLVGPEIADASNVYAILRAVASAM